MRWDLHDPHHAGNGERRLRIAVSELPAQHGRSRHDRVQHAVEARIDPIDGASHHDVGAVGGARARFSDVAKLRRVLQPHLRRLGNGLAHRRFGELAIGESLSGAAMQHLLSLGDDFSDRYPPVGRGRTLEHHACRRANPPHGLEEVPHAARAVRVLAAVPGLIRRCLDDAHPRPLRLELVSDYQREAGADALTHLRAVHGDQHGIVRMDRDEHQGVVDHSTGVGICSVDRGLTRPHDPT